MVQISIVLFTLNIFLIKISIYYALPFDIYKHHIKTLHYNNRGLGNFEINPIKKDYLLPDTITPKEYYLKFVPYFKHDHFKFIGQTKILLLINRDTNKIVLNSVDLNYNESTIQLQKVSIDGTISKDVNVKDVRNNSSTEQVIIITETSLITGDQYNLIINYTGYLSEGMNGFYRSWYSNNSTIR